MPAAKVGLGVFLAVVGCLFALFTSAYFMRMGLSDWQPLPVPRLLWLNTGVLVLSSVALQCALIAARRRPARYGAGSASSPAGITALAFLVGQLMAWRELAADGYFLASNPANSFFYLITGMHGLHILGGLVALGRDDRQGLDAAMADGAAAAQRRAVRHVLAFPAVRLAGRVRAAGRLGRRLHRYLPPVADLERIERMAETTVANTGSSRGPAACKASPPTGPPTSGRSRTSPGARP